MRPGRAAVTVPFSYTTYDLTVDDHVRVAFGVLVRFRESRRIANAVSIVQR